MFTQSDVIRLNEDAAGLRARVAFLFDGADDLRGSEAAERAKAIKSANAALTKTVDLLTEATNEVNLQRIQRDGIKTARLAGMGQRQINDDNAPGYGSIGAPRAPRAPGPDWGTAVVEAVGEMAEARGTKSFITSGSATVASTVGGPVADPRRARFVSDLIPAENAEGGHFAYLRQTVRDNQAAVVAPGAKKPTSIYTLTRIDDTTDVIAHLTEPISRQDLDDAAVLRQFIDAELRLGLELAVDASIIAAILAASPLVEGDIGSVLDTTRRSLTRLQEREVEPTAWLLCPRDWEQVENEAQTTFAANSNMAPATNSVKRTLHGYPVFLSNAVPENTGYLGDFATSSTIYRTGPVRIDWSEGHYDTGEDATDFERNLVRFRAEARVGIAILRSFAFVQINLAATGS